MIGGNLTKEPEIVKTKNENLVVVKFVVATNHFKAKGGRDTTFHNVVVFGKQAEKCLQYLKKGSQVVVGGRQEHRAYEQKGEPTKYFSQIVAGNVQFAGRFDPSDRDNENQGGVMDSQVREDEDKDEETIPY